MVSVLHMLADAVGALTVVRQFAARLMEHPARIGWGREGMDRRFTQLLGAAPVARWPRLTWESVRQLALPLRYLSLARPADLWPANDPQVGKPVHRTLEIPVGEGSTLRRRCGQIDCTINDALVALLALANRSLFRRGKIGNVFTVNLRPMLADDRPRVANLSGLDLVILPPGEVEDFDMAASAVRRRTVLMKQRFQGLAAVLANHAPMMAMPHGLLRSFIRLWLRWALAVIDRTLVVTNIGTLEPYLEPYGDRALRASVVGPFLAGIHTPVVTATGFRDRLTLQINGYDGPSMRQLDLVERQLRHLTTDWT